MIEIRNYHTHDWAACWRTLEPVFRAGDTYAVPTDISEQDAQALWVAKPAATYRPIRPPCTFGSGTDSRSSGPCPRRSVIRVRGSWMPL